MDWYGAAVLADRWHKVADEYRDQTTDGAYVAWASEVAFSYEWVAWKLLSQKVRDSLPSSRFRQTGESE